MDRASSDESAKLPILFYHRGMPYTVITGVENRIRALVTPIEPIEKIDLQTCKNDIEQLTGLKYNEQESKQWNLYRFTGEVSRDRPFDNGVYDMFSVWAHGNLEANFIAMNLESLECAINSVDTAAKILAPKLKREYHKLISVSFPDTPQHIELADKLCTKILGNNIKFAECASSRRTYFIPKSI
jgi:hypothetical protein